MRVGVIGVGSWAMRTHLPALLSIPAVEVSGVWARRPDAVSAAAGANHVAGFTDLDALLCASDAVSIAVAPSAQPELALRAAAAGCHVILEKPLGEDSAQAERVAEAIESAGVHGVVFATREWDSARRNAMESLVGSAVGGSLRYVWRSRGMLGRAATWRREAGALLDVGPHMMPMMERIAGPIVEVRRAQFPSESLVRAELGHEGGAVSMIDIDTAVDVPFTREAIEATSGRRTLRWENDEPVDFVAAYLAMFAAFERICAGEATSLDLARGTVASQVRASDVLAGMEVGTGERVTRVGPAGTRRPDIRPERGNYIQTRGRCTDASS